MASTVLGTFKTIVEFFFIVVFLGGVEVFFIIDFMMNNLISTVLLNLLDIKTIEKDHFIN